MLKTLTFCAVIAGIGASPVIANPGSINFEQERQRQQMQQMQWEQRRQESQIRELEYQQQRMESLNRYPLY